MSGADHPSNTHYASLSQRFEPGPLLADAKDWEQTSFFKWMGMRVLDAADGRGRLVLDVQEHHRGGGGTVAVNGGVLAYMLDAVVGLAVHSNNPPDTVGQVTLSLNVEYLAPVMVASQVLGEGEVVRRGGSLAFVDGRLYADDGSVACRAHAVLRVFRRRA
ncbi:MAG: PaaI family thioesterase [Panacagrimonas sp.]